MGYPLPDPPGTELERRTTDAMRAAQEIWRPLPNPPLVSILNVVHLKTHKWGRMKERGVPSKP